jgi:hypothetical protein
MPVNTANKEYEGNKYKWSLVRDCCEGSEAVKNASRTDAAPVGSGSTLETYSGTKYLPAPNSSDNSQENVDRYKAYKKRANFVNFTGHSKEAFAGMVCRVPPAVELPTLMEPMRDNIDGMGNSLTDAIKRTLDEVLTTAREGILVDHPVMPAGLSQEQTAGITATLKSYCAESIINWKTKMINGRMVLSMVVLKEEEAVPEDEFTDDYTTIYRVLKLTEDNVYIQNIYDEDGDLMSNVDGETDIIPRQHNGSAFDFIPFYFIGALNNDPHVDRPPLYDLAEVNLAHYRNSADYEESCFMVGQPTPVMSGLTQGWVNDVLKGKVMMGSRAFVPLPTGGSAMLLQANPNQMPAEGMKMKEAQMIQIGAKIITDSGQAETAEAAKIRFSGQNSKLGTVVDNIEKAYEKCLEWVGIFMGVDATNIDVNLNREFYERGANPEMIMAQIQMLSNSVISVGDIRNYLRDTSYIDADRTDEDIEADIGDTSPLVGTSAPPMVPEDDDEDGRPTDEDDDESDDEDEDQ